MIYKKAERPKEGMVTDTEVEPFEEIKPFE